MTKTLETAITDFLSAGRIYQEKNITAREIMKDMLASYKDVRIDNADIQSDGDMLLFQWGAGKSLLLTEPTDLRNLEVEDGFFKHDLKKLQYLNFTRQVFAINDESDTFDDLAVQLSTTLIYGVPAVDEKSSNIWISTPEQSDAVINQYLTNALVAQLIDTRPTRILTTVENCG